MMAPFAQVVFRGMSFSDLMIGLVIFLGICAVAAIVIRAMNIPVPPWVWELLGVIVVVLVGVAAIRLIAGI